jgi:hypothetical protein
MYKAMFVAALALAGCGATVRTTTMPGANLSQYHTFSFAQQQAGHESLADQTIRGEIARSLEARGLREVQANPDFVVATHVKTQQRMDVMPGPYYGWGYGDVYEYTEGTLIVDFVDPKTNQVFWRGTASQTVDHPNNPDLNKVAQATSKLMMKLPFQMAAAGTPQPVPQPM